MGGYFCAVTLTDNKVSTVLARYRQRLEALYEVPEVHAIQRAVFQHHLGWDRADLEMRRHAALSESELMKVYLPLKRLQAGEPLQYVLGSVSFHGMDIHVGPGVLIPRPETEEMVELIVRSGAMPRCIVDVGTGSGVIALALKRAFPLARVIGIDVSEEALMVARSNAARLGLEVDWTCMDVLSDAAILPLEADLVVSNPPYIPRSEAMSVALHVREHEPSIALFVNDEDPVLFFRCIAALALRSGAQLWFEGHHRLVHRSAEAVRALGYGGTRVIVDLSGAPRFIHAVR